MKRPIKTKKYIPSQGYCKCCLHLKSSHAFVHGSNQGKCNVDGCNCNKYIFHWEKIFPEDACK